MLNNKTIKNIAISGPYGAGKSSIIDTFIKKNKFTHNYLKVSLATFQDLKNVESEKHPTSSDREKLERLIELSLLQQFFYHEEDKNIPDSQFQKNRKVNKDILFLFTFLVLLFGISLEFVFPDNVVSNFISKYMPFFAMFTSIFEKVPKSKFLLSGYILFFIFGCIYRLLKLAFYKSALKLSVPHAEIEIGKDISKSALNTYLDEILYFFEVSKYDVVFIEDLDRFEQSDIFVKLRELNQLINNSKKIKQDVVFVYAIKDDMFMNKERTKFFDFIIPVIPVINNSNSKDKLQTILQSSSYQISEDLISDISIFIDDMRLLYNIINEFYQYEQILKKSALEPDNLLAIITYKNLFPNDFVNLMQNKGVLYDSINKKAEYVNIRKAEIDGKIKLVQDKIEASKNQMQKNIKELRLMYVSIAAEKLLNSNGRYFITQSGNRLSFLQLTENEYFELLKTKKLYYYSNYGNSLFSEDFSVIEQKIDPEENYSQKEQNILNKLNPSSLYKEIEELKKEKEQVQKLLIKDLIVSGDVKLSAKTNDKEKVELIERLLRNGYINENYLDYISIFHEGSLQKSDYDFLLNVKRNEKTPYDYKLYQKKELIKQINIYDFEKGAILNFDLLDELLIDDNASEKRAKLFSQLANGKENTIEFIDKFVNVTKHLEFFIKDICYSWADIWSVLFKLSPLSRHFV